ncbi:MAG: hypothetical protein FJW23_00680 [Acidimicrobiia bacterium]|nr:hypothetical protein [Acidimicrobiia bacterium]
MKRAFVAGLLLSGGLLGPAAVPARAQGADPRMMAVGDNVGLLFIFVVDGQQHSFAFGGEDDRITLLDTRAPGSSNVIANKVAQGAEGDIVRIILTNARGGASIGEYTDATEIVAHEKTKAAMAAMNAFKGANAKFLPNKTFTDTLSFTVKTVGEGEGTNRIDLHYFGPGSTAGDTVVVFPSLNTVVLGDLFPGKMTPVIDSALGGSGVAIADTVAKAVTALKAVQPPIKFVMGSRQLPPPGPYVPRWFSMTDLQEYADFARAFVDAARAAKTEGKSAEQAVATLGLPERFKNYRLDHARAWVEAIYAELK